MPSGKIDIIVGMQWGDEGKGKIAHYLLGSGAYGWCARYQGGGNAGHTIYDQKDETKVVLHTLPTGIVYDGMDCVIGNGELVDLESLHKEIEALRTAEKFRGKLYISDRAHVTHPYLKELEVTSGDRKAFGTTGYAIGPTYMLKAARKGLRICDFDSSSKVKSRIKEAISATLLDNFPLDRHREFDDAYASRTADEQMRLFGEILKAAQVCDTSHLINTWLGKGKDGLAEGAQGTGLSIDHGTYPDVTSSNTEAGGACTGLGVGPTTVRKVYGVAKAYVTRVGTGPFPTLMGPETEQIIREKGGEYGATTGRPRRCGWWDSVLARKAVEVSGIGAIVITKPDVLSGIPKICASTKYMKAGCKEMTELFPPDLEQLNGENSSNYLGILDHQQEGWQPFKGSDIPESLEKYLKFIEETCGAPVTMLSTGPKTGDVIKLEKK